MLSDRILFTLHYFDLQEYALTSFELWRYLISDPEGLRRDLDQNFQLKDIDAIKPVPVHFDTLMIALESLVGEDKVVKKYGLYCLPQSVSLIGKRLGGYRHGLHRERRIRKFLKFTKLLPFVRSISIAGSQALGLKKTSSDIDLLILTDSRFMWLARIVLSSYFQILGMRRHGKKIKDRFCLNHYFADPSIRVKKNLYTATEYSKLRHVVYQSAMIEFQSKNQDWIRMFFPNIKISPTEISEPALIQKAFEFCFNNRFGLWLNAKLGAMQLQRIRQDEFTYVTDKELSFHPNSKQELLLKQIFG